MDPIQRKTTPDIQPPVAPEAGKSAGGTTRAFNVGNTGAPPATGGQTSAQPVFSQMASVIQDGVGRSLTKDQVRDELIDREVKSTFGDKATPQMTAAISDAFKGDTHLTQLFNQLYAKATKK